MITGDAVKELATQLRVPKEVNTAGVLAVPVDWKLVHPHETIRPLPAAPTFGVATLGALAEYLSANRDALPIESLIVHVETPWLVTVSGPLRVGSRDREVFIRATASDLLGCYLNTYHAHEDIAIALQTRCCDAAQRDELLRMLGTIKNEMVRTSTDDGITQVVEAKAGIVFKSEVAIPNPVTLSAFRTFRDIVQPESPFVLRARAGKVGGLPEFALFEADGGAWQLTTLARIRDWLEEHLPTGVAVLA